MKLARKLQALRESHELTQEKLARLAGVTQAYIARIEADKVDNPKASGLVAIGKALGVPMEVLLDEELSIEEWQNEISSLRIDTADRELLRAYRSLRSKEKQLLLGFARMLRHQGKVHKRG
jgi:transcriptional regulator with XRE-family HTH domain